MKIFKLILSLLFLGLAVVLTGMYFEYFVSRPVSIWIIIPSGLVVLAMDILAFIFFTKTIKNTLNF